MCPVVLGGVSYGQGQALILNDLGLLRQGGREKDAHSSPRTCAHLGWK